MSMYQRSRALPFLLSIACVGCGSSPTATPVVNPVPSKAFYYENFSTTPDGAVPSGWVGGEKLIVTRVGRAQTLLISSVNDDIKDSASTPAIQFPQDFRVEAVVSMEEGSAWGGGCSAAFGLQVGSVSVGTNTAMCSMVIPYFDGDTAQWNGAIGRNATFALEKRANVFSFTINGQRVLLKRIADFQPPDRIRINVWGRQGRLEIHSVSASAL